MSTFQPVSLPSPNGIAAFWNDPHGCFLTDEDSDCGTCYGGCGTQREYLAPNGPPLATSVNVDDSTSTIEYEPGVNYSDCTSFSHFADSGEGCRPDNRPCDDCDQYGQSVSIAITRTFTHNVDQLSVFLTNLGRIDDIGYVGDTQLNDCCEIFYDFPLDVTDQVVVSGNVATFTIRAADVACGENIISLNFRWQFSLKE